MDYRKLDAALAGQLERGSPSALINVFIQTDGDLTERQAAELAALGVSVGEPGQRTLAAAVTPDALDKLSQLPWIRRIALSRKLRPLGSGEQ